MFYCFQAFDSLITFTKNGKPGQNVLEWVTGQPPPAIGDLLLLVDNLENLENEDLEKITMRFPTFVIPALRSIVIILRLRGQVAKFFFRAVKAGKFNDHPYILETNEDFNSKL